MGNRDRHDIAIDILKKASSGMNKTELMKEVGLSFSQAKQYLSMLQEKRLLEIGDKHHFKTTRKGLEFLEKCEACPLFSWDK
jgi:predicted transcriptional regulator